MKNCALISFFIVYFVTLSFAQQNRIALSPFPPGNKIIAWQKVTKQNFPGIGTRFVLSFENSQYNLNEHWFPVYLEKIQLPESASNAEAELSNEVYIPLSDSEITALNSYSIQNKTLLTSQVLPKITISFFKKKPFAYIQFIPIRKNKLTGSYEKMISFSLKVNPVYDSNTPRQNSSLKTNASVSVLAKGKWFKVSVASDGVYKMDYSFLKSLGMDIDSINPKNLHVYGNGGGQLPFANARFRYDDLQENAILVFGENDGKFNPSDYVLFYGQSQHRWKYNTSDKKFHHALNIYSDSTCYFITADGVPGKRISLQNSSAATSTNNVSSFDDFQFHEAEAVNLLMSGRQWLGETFDILTSYDFTFNFPNIETSSQVYTRVEVGARADTPGTDFSWSAGSASSSFNVSSVDISQLDGIYYNKATDNTSFFPSSGIVKVTISKVTPSPSIGWLNYIEVNARRGLTLSGAGDQMNFRDMTSVKPGNISQFSIANATSSLQVWEVTNPLNVKLQQTIFSGSTLAFTLPTDSLREFCVFNGLSFFTPHAEGKVKNQNLHGLPQSDLIIVTNPLFLSQANMLAQLHRKQDNLSVAVATTEEVYNEFSSGSQDVSAIRDFVRMFYTRAADSIHLPKYLLLFGRGSYNLKARINNTNLVPAYESANSYSPTDSYPSDDFYGMLDINEGDWDVTNDVLDIGIGRLPVQTGNEASNVVNKITKYTSVPGTIETANSCSSDLCYGLGDWVNYLAFMADDEDGDEHIDYADSLAKKIYTTYNEYNLDKIYLDAYQQFSTPGGERYPDATAAFMRRMDKGALIVNYTGHGGPLGLAHERFLEIHDINSWKNQCKLPLFFTATCEFSRWDDPALISAGELTFLNPDGGSIGLMSTTRVVYGPQNFTLNQNFYTHAFVPLTNGKMPRLGDLHMLTKRDMNPIDINHRNFSLLADPALTLHYPGFSVATISVNGVPTNSSKKDTVRALSRVTVQGEVRDKNGNPLPNFNGIIYPTVFDKASTITTLSNDGAVASPTMTFLLQKNILFKGKASVSSGKFSFSFIVPKDIAYNYGKGKISYYSHNGYEDANGYFEDFIVGGLDTTAATDATGPDIKLFMNDDKFVMGGITNTDPKIYVVVSDSNGINTAGSSIGHDITAVLDGNNTQPLVLNDYYESDLDNYKKGSVRYPLTGLSEGRHSITVKVWDVYDNSSSSTTEFVVASSAKIALTHVLNYPNPFTSKTSFYFEHNRCCTTMDVQVQIFTVSGKLVKTIHQLVNMEGFRSEPIDWNGTDDFGDRIGRGVYIYRLRVKTDAGETAEKFEKLVILK